MLGEGNTVPEGAKGRGISDPGQWVTAEACGTQQSREHRVGRASILPVLYLLLTAFAACGCALTGSATDPRAHRKPVPVNKAAPAVTGLAFRHDRLFTTNGKWNNRPTRYAYQWEDCDSSGASCVKATGPGNSCSNSGKGCSYIVAASDEGHTLRVTVTARNIGGSSSPVSSRVVPSRGTVPGAGAIIIESFNGRYDLGRDGCTAGTGWCLSPPPPATWKSTSFIADGTGNKALQVSTCAFDDWSNSIPICSNGQSAGNTRPFGTQAGTYLLCAQFSQGGTKMQCPFNDTESGSASSGQDAWYRVRIKFPTGYRPSPNGYNWLIEPFDNQICRGCHSPALGVETDSVKGACSGSPAVCTVPGPRPALRVQYSGGPTSNPQIHSSDARANSLRRNVWYDIVMHMKYSTTAGAVQWWTNTGSGWKRMGNVTGVPTMYYTGVRSPDCTLAGNSCAAFKSFNVELYHEWATWSQAVYFEDLVAGPSAASVGEPALG